jgi:DNA polymerase
MFASAKGWRREFCHGGDGFNRVVQGSAGDLLRHSVLELRKAGINVVLRVYDELVCEVPEDLPYETFKQLFLSRPAWASDIPITGEGWEGARYKKD